MYRVPLSPLCDYVLFGVMPGFYDITARMMYSHTLVYIYIVHTHRQIMGEFFLDSLHVEGSSVSGA